MKIHKDPDTGVEVKTAPFGEVKHMVDDINVMLGFMHEQDGYLVIESHLEDSRYVVVNTDGARAWLEISDEMEVEIF